MDTAEAMRRIEQGLEDGSIKNAEAYHSPQRNILHLSKDARHFIIYVSPDKKEVEWVELKDGDFLRWILLNASKGSQHYTLTK